MTDKIKALLQPWLVATIAFLTALSALLVATNSGGGGSGQTPTPSPTPTLTVESPTPTPTTNNIACLPDPSTCGYPDSTNTGFPVGTDLVSHPGTQTIKVDGTVIDGWDTGRIEIEAKNVTIKNSRITTSSYYGIHVSGGHGWGPVIVDHVTIVGLGTTTQQCDVGIDVGSVTITHTDISNCADGIHAHGNNQIIDNYIHDLYELPNSLRPDAAHTHNDGIQAFSGNGLVIKHNTIDLGSCKACNSALFVQPTSGKTVIDGVTVDSNLVDGAGYTLYIEESQNVTLSNNRVGKDHKWGWFSKAHNTHTPTLVNNIWDATGLPIGS